MEEKSFEKRGAGMSDMKQESKQDIPGHSYKRYRELGGIINEQDCQSALIRAQGMTLDAARVGQPEEMEKRNGIEQAKNIARYAGIKLQESENVLDLRIRMYVTLRGDRNPAVKFHHSTMADERLFAEVLRMLEDSDSLRKLIEAYPHISFS